MNLSSLRFGLNLVLWYAFTLVSAIYTKKFLNETNDSFSFTFLTFAYGTCLKWTLELVSLFKSGCVASSAGNGDMRKDASDYYWLAFFNIASLLLTNIAINQMSVSFIYMVKVSEPVFVLVLSYIMMGESYNGYLMLTLIPICTGVSLTILGNMEFSAYGLAAIFFGNLATASRSIYFKKKITAALNSVSSSSVTPMLAADQSSETTTEATTETKNEINPIAFYLNVTHTSFILFAPLFLAKLIISHYTESKRISWLLTAIGAESSTSFESLMLTLRYLVLGTLANFLYNFFSVRVLKSLAPITHSVINIMKRMLVVVASVFSFGHSVTGLQIVGVAMADSGVLAYSFFKMRTSVSVNIDAHVIHRRRLAKRIILTTIACVLLVALVHDDSTTSLLTKLGGGKSAFRASNAHNEQMRVTCLNKIRQQIVDSFVDLLPRDSKACILDLPTHGDHGDSLMWFGEDILFKKMNITYTFEMLDGALTNTGEERMRTLVGNDTSVTILMHAGGNFGDLYRLHTLNRNKMVRWFPDHKIIFLPQTIYYKNTTLLEEDAALYASHKHLTITARCNYSYQLAAQNFASRGTPVHYVPDLAFMMGPLEPSIAKPLIDILILKRTDGESLHSLGWDKEIFEQLAFRYSYLQVDWFFYKQKAFYQSIESIKEYRAELVNKVVSQARVIITDRLHVSIYSLLIGRPHVMLDNKYGKVSGVRQAAFQNKTECQDAYFNAFYAKDPADAVRLAVEILEKL